MKAIILTTTILLTTLISSAQKPEKYLTDAFLRNDSFYIVKGDILYRGKVVGGGSQSTIEYFPLSQSFYSITSGTGANKNAGFYNTIIGNGAGDSCTGCYYNTFIGKDVGHDSRSVFDCIGIGWDALHHSRGGSNLIALGQDALYWNLGGRDNTAISRGALFYNQGGHDNHAIGLNAMANNYFGVENVAFGSYTLNFMGNGSRNVAIGTYAMELNELEGDSTTAINESTAIGYAAGFNSKYTNFIAIGANTNVTANGQINIGNKIFYRNNSFEIAGSNITINGYTYHVTNTPPSGMQSQLIADGFGNVSWQPTSSTTTQKINNYTQPETFVGYNTAGQMFFFKRIK